MKRKLSIVVFTVLTLCFCICRADIQLQVKRLEQKYQYSCETATLRMALNYYGLKLSEDEIIAKMPFDKTPHKSGIWGDPDKGFVGKIDGKSGQESYGIHWEPLKKVALNWKRAEVIENGRPIDLIEHLKNNRPIIVWIYSGEKKTLKWKTSTGKVVKALWEEHTVVVTGFKGAESNIEGFYIVDPAKDKVNKFIAADKFLKIWKGFGYKGLVIYP